MTTITIEEAQSNLSDLIDRLAWGEQLAIVRGDRVVARLIGDPAASPLPEEKTLDSSSPSNEGPWPCKAGSAKDKILWISPDFDEPLEEFREYTE